MISLGKYSYIIDNDRTTAHDIMYSAFGGQSLFLKHDVK